MRCPSCQAENDELAVTCFRCGKGIAAVTRGSLIDSRYEILSLLGKGGSGTVYKAHDRVLDETVAVKVLRSDFARAPEIERRFRSEIKLARKVTHKNVCRIYEYGEEGRIRYISMEFVDGTDLRQLLERGPLAPREAFDVAIQAAEGLRAVHDVGIIHRDLKPLNITRDRQGRVRLMDFGLAKLGNGGATTAHTATGHMVGTPAYMSPEQVRGDQVGFRSDIYALGIVVFEIFTGRPPFRGEAPVVVLKQLEQPPPLEGPEAARLPPSLVPVLRKALAKDPSKRYATSQALIEALRQARAAWQRRVDPAQGPTLVGPGPQSPESDSASHLETPTFPMDRPGAARRWRRAWLPTAAALVLVVLGGVAAWRVSVARNAAAGLTTPTLSAGLPGAGLSLPQEVSPAPSAPVATRGATPDAAPLPSPPVAPAPAAIAPKPPRTAPAPASAKREATLRTIAVEPPLAPWQEGPEKAPPPSPEPVASAPAVRSSDVARLLQSLNAADSLSRAEAANALGALGPEGKVAVTPLIAALKDPDSLVRKGAAEALGRIGPDAKASMPALIEAVADPDWEVRAAAVSAVGSLQSEPRMAVPAMAQAIKDDVAEVRAAAAWALGKSAWALGKRGREAESAKEILTAALKDGDRRVRLQSAIALAMI